MASRNEDDLAPSKTEGFKVGEKKTLDEYAKLGMGSCHSPPCDILFLLILMCMSCTMLPTYLKNLSFPQSCALNGVTLSLLYQNPFGCLSTSLIGNELLNLRVYS